MEGKTMIKIYFMKTNSQKGKINETNVELERNVQENEAGSAGLCGEGSTLRRVLGGQESAVRWFVVVRELKHKGTKGESQGTHLEIVVEQAVQLPQRPVI